MKIPTYLQIFQLIFNSYYDDFESFSKQKKNRETKNYVPIDIELLAEKFNVDGDIIFGR